MDNRSEVLVVGEDLLDPYGGAFKVSKGLSSRFPERVIPTPISEAGIVGVGIGLALRGFRPVLEIMFGDFITLIADQLINQASKITSMYNRPISLPIVVRTPMGGRRGYGPTHSQSLEKLYFGIPGLDVVGVSNVHHPGKMLSQIVTHTDVPTLFIENKSLYSTPLLNENELFNRYGLKKETNENIVPTVILTHDNEPDITFITYGGMTPLVIEAIDFLHREEDLSCEILVVHRISPLDVEPLINSVKKTRRTVVVEEGITDWGWGAEVLAMLAIVEYEAPPQRVGAGRYPIPVCRHLEDKILPQVDDIIKAAIRTVDQSFI
jgi:pyruvate/2-oxoglutarate/acetoin dehydrogenase E1 component